ncbi:MAG: response regulator [Bacteroidetes bacterium]|nr:response regulator [Bacteroidota bacterium]
MFYFKDKDVLVFLIDDNKLELKLLKNQFATCKENYKVKTYITGEGFINEIIENPIPEKYIVFIILDYFLKTKQNKEARDGIQILNLIKEINPKFNIIILSAYEKDDNLDFKKQYKDLRATAYVRKNEFSFPIINNIIQRIVFEKNFKRRRIESRLLTIVLIIATLIILIFSIFY